MKLTIQILGILILSIFATGVTYWIKGDPMRYADVGLLDDVSAQQGEIKIEDIRAQKKDVLWIDARSRRQWASNGLVGSLFISSDPREEMEQLIAENMQALFDAETEECLVVIYCDQVVCSDSKNVVVALREAGFKINLFRLKGGYAALASESTWEKKNN